jgi:hypothetical protein
MVMRIKSLIFIICLVIFSLASHFAGAQDQLFGCSPTTRYSDLLIIDKGDASKSSVVAIDFLNLSDITFKSDGTLYGSTGKSTNGDVLEINPATGEIAAVKAIGDEYKFLKALVFDGDSLYASAQSGSFGVYLLIDPTTGDVTQEGDHGLLGAMDGMAFLDAILYGIQGNTLYTMNKENGSSVVVADLSGVDGDMEGLASDGISLYGCDDLGYVYTIDETNGVCTQLGNPQPIPTELSGLAFNPVPITPGAGTIALDTLVPPTWSYNLTHTAGEVSEWRLFANEIIGASAPAGWSVFDLTISEVIFKADTPITSGTVTGFEVTGNASADVYWRVHSSTGVVAGPTYALPFDYTDHTVAVFEGDVLADEQPATGSPFNLGFTFPFFGVEYTNVYINPNGHLTFGTAPSGFGTDWNNQSFPLDDSTPRIAPFWDDFDPTSEGRGTVYYKAVDNKFVVSYIDVLLYEDSPVPDITNTFQVILFGDGSGKPAGSIAFGYSDLNGVRSDDFGEESATVGINAGNGADFKVFPEVGSDGIVTSEELGQYFLLNRNFLFTPGDASATTYTTSGMGDDLTAHKGTVELDGPLPEGTPGHLKIWTYKLTWESGELSQWMYLGTEITSATAAAGWSVAEKNDQRVIFTTNNALTSGEVSGFKIYGHSINSSGEWISHGKSGGIQGPQVSLPIDPQHEDRVVLESYGSPIPIDFNFPFFGDDKSTVYVSSNGNLWFDEDIDGDSSNRELNISDGIGRIAGFWDDLAPEAGDVSYYKNPLAGLFAVTYLYANVDSSDENTVQIILLGPGNSYGFPTGTIALCYGPLNGIRNNATIGLSNGSGNYATIGEKTSELGIAEEGNLAGIQNRNFVFKWQAGIGQYSVKELLDDESLPVLLSQFGATMEKDSITIKWTTASEVDNLGFNLYRSSQKDGPYQKLNSKLIPGSLNAVISNQYQFTDKEVESGKTYFYFLENVDIKGLKSQSEIIEVVAPFVQPIPKESRLFQNYPNPFNPETWIPYDLESAAAVHLRIFDIKGTLIRHLDLGKKAAGSYQQKNSAAYWDGRNSTGERVASGNYFYTLQAGNFIQTRRMVILK